MATIEDTKKLADGATDPKQPIIRKIKFWRDVVFILFGLMFLFYLLSPIEIM